MQQKSSSRDQMAQDSCFQLKIRRGIAFLMFIILMGLQSLEAGLQQIALQELATPE